MPTGNVSVRLSIQDAETVRSALEKLGNDGQAALKKLETASSHPAAGLSAIDKGVASAKARLDELGQSLGPVGSLLGGLGPVGVAAAAGLGVAILAFGAISKAVDELVAKSARLQSFAEVTGLSTDQLQSLDLAAEKFGKTGDDVGAALERFTVNWEDLRRGSGQMLEQIRLVNPALADQMQHARDTATAVDILAKAYAAAGSQEQRNRLSTAAFGRNGVTVGNAILSGASDAGGMNEMGKSAAAAGDIIDRQLIAKLRQLQTEINNTKSRAGNEFASIFAVNQKGAQLEMAQLLERVAKAFKDISESDPAAAVDRWFTSMGRGLDGLLGTENKPSGPMITINATHREGDQVDGIPLPRSRPAAADYVPETDEGRLKDIQGRLSFLGAAATPAEQLKVRLEALTLSAKNYKLEVGDLARAQGYLTQSESLEIESARERLGVATQEQILTAKLIELKRQEAAAGVQPGSQEDVQARQRVQRESEQAYRNQQIQNSQFKGLAGLANPDTNAAIDQLSTSTLDRLSSSIVEVGNNWNHAGETARQFALTTAEAIEQTILKLTLLKVVSGGLSGLFGGVGGAGGTTGNPTIAGSLYAAGGIMTSHGPLPLNRYAGGGVANTPQVAIFGEGRGPEAYVPLPDGRAIPVALAKGGGGGHTINTTHVINYHAAPGTAPADGAHQAKQFARTMQDTLERAIDQRIIRHMQSGGLLNQ